jgi:LysM repeat protein
MIRTTLYIGLLLFTLNASAQESIQADTEGGKPYISHTVSNGETMSAIARSYKLTVGEIAAFNKMSADKGLQKGQALRIPLKASNLVQTECSGCRKVYYKVQPKEGLYRIGLNFGNIAPATLQKLNNLSGESVDIGQNLLVGYAYAPAGKPSNETVKKEPEVTKEETVKTDNKTSDAIDRTEKPVVQKTSPPVDEKKVEQQPVTVGKQSTPSVETTVQNNNTNAGGAGSFAPAFQGKAGVAKTGTAAIFKSTSGWEDAKYYVLMSNAEPGTIVKVSNPVTSKTVYAKILGELPAIKQNENILLRISNAAAAALGGGEDSLNVTVNY